ncbi:HAD family hydrolase [Streptococcus pneumoniae]|uniref:phosphoserine phosphatase n=1 Tax=Streptococcus pneumoniae TaxID=1313 RepID=UPI0005E756AD|nr:phosphoserine phosphatase [Streptococcus pneumoniae]CKG69644.1 phosphoserine phosphatase [Streptococcus pneumoniae]
MSQVKGLCVLDVDGTLILEEVIDLLGREAGHEAEISQVSLLEGLPILVFDNVFNSIHLSLNVPEFISILQKNGILVGLVCGVWWIPIVGEISKIPWYCLFHCQPA